MNLGNKITELRKINKLSQEELAYKLDISSQSISLWETNQSKPSTEKLLELSKVFNIKLEDLISDEDFELERYITVNTIHTKNSYNKLVKETTTFKRFIVKMIPLILVLLIFYFTSELETTEFIIVAIILTVVFIPIILLISKYLELKKIKKKIDFSKRNLQKFIFKNDELSVLFENDISKTESNIKYEAFKKVLMSNDYLYLEHPTNKMQFFQIDLNNFEVGNRKELLEFLNEKKMVAKNIKTKKTFNQHLYQAKKLSSNKKMYMLLIAAIVFSFLTLVVTGFIINNGVNDLDSYHSNRTNLYDLLYLVVLVVVPISSLVFAISLWRKQYKSKMIIASFIIIPVLLLQTIMITLLTPTVFYGNRFTKNYDTVKEVFDSANVYLPTSSLVITEKSFIYNEENYSPLNYTFYHKVLVKNDLNGFQNSLITNSNWTTDKTLIMKGKLNVFVDREADYYLIYNKTANNYNDEELLDGVNEMIVFYYVIETKEIFIYEFYLLN